MLLRSMIARGMTSRRKYPRKMRKSTGGRDGQRRIDRELRRLAARD